MHNMVKAYNLKPGNKIRTWCWNNIQKRVNPKVCAVVRVVEYRDGTADVVVQTKNGDRDGFAIIFASADTEYERIG